MRIRSILVSVLVALASAQAQGANPYDPPLRSYAKQCFDELELAYDAAKGVHPELLGPFDCRSAAAKRLKLEVNGHVKDIGVCDASGGSCPAEGTRPTTDDKCDYPAWLELSANHCYGNTYVQKIPTPSRKDVTAVLLCRHKSAWSNKSTDFDDIAMIVHNRTNGETCWFQSREVPQDGSKVPGPEAASSGGFLWMTPLETAQVGCVGCHDNGPFMNSRWMERSGIGISDGASSPYKNSTKPFDRWPEPRFVDAGDNPDGGMECTACHKISAGGRHTVDLNPGRPGGVVDVEFQTCADCNAICTTDPLSDRCRRDCRGWIQRVTGRTSAKHPRGANARALADDHAIWMPDIDTWTRASWDKEYKRHVDHLMKCCDAVGKLPKRTSGKPGTFPLSTLANCSEFVPEVKNASAVVAPAPPTAEEVVARATPPPGDRPPPEDAPPDDSPVETPDDTGDAKPPPLPLETDPLPPAYAKAAGEALDLIERAAETFPDAGRLRCWIDKLRKPDVDDQIIPWTRICPKQGPNAALCKVTSVGEAALAEVSDASQVPVANAGLTGRKFIVHLRSDALRKVALRPPAVSDKPNDAVIVDHLVKMGDDVALAETKLKSGDVTAPGYAGVRAWIEQRRKDPKSVYQCNDVPKQQQKESAASCKWNSMDVVDPRIDDGAQQSLMRKLRLQSPASDRAEGSAMLGAIKNETLEAIWKPYRPGVGARAQKLGKTGDALIPAGRGATCVKEPADEKPLIVYRSGLADAQIDAALSEAWKECGLPTPEPPCGYEVVLKPEPEDRECETDFDCFNNDNKFVCDDGTCEWCLTNEHCEMQSRFGNICEDKVCIGDKPPPVELPACQKCNPVAERIQGLRVCPANHYCSEDTNCCLERGGKEDQCVEEARKEKFATRKGCQAREIEGIKSCVDDSRKCAGVELPPKPFDKDCFDVFNSCVLKNPKYAKEKCHEAAEKEFRRKVAECNEVK